jgi:transposase-like protein
LEVRAVAKRRQFTAAYKLAVLEEAARLSEPGAIGALLRRESLYSLHLSVWWRERDSGALEALSRRRGRKSKLSAEQKRVAALEARCTRLQHELDQAHTIIEVQKNSARCWSCPRQPTTRAPGATHERGGRTHAADGRALCVGPGRKLTSQGSGLRLKTDQGV